MKCDLDTLLNIHARSIRVENEVFVPYNRQERLVRLFEAVKDRYKALYHFGSNPDSKGVVSVIQKQIQDGHEQRLMEWWDENCSCIRIVGETTEGLSRKASEWHTNGCKIHEEGK